MSNNENQPWWHSLYDSNLAAMLLNNGDPQEISNTRGFLEEYLDLKPKQRIFDQCCGTGRLALELAKDHEVVGLDLIDTYIESAILRSKDLEVDAEFIIGDAFTYALKKPADIAINWWTSFGYSEDRHQNMLMIRMAFESIKSRGYYALDFMNVAGIYRHFLPDVVTSVVHDGQELTLIRKSSIDFERDRLIKEWRYFTEDGKQTLHHSDVSLYSPAQLKSMFEHVGFTDVCLYGDLMGGELDLSSPRCIVTGKKP